MARRKATPKAPSGAAVEQPLAIDGSAAAEPSADAADEPVAVYGHSADIHELKDAHNERESDPAWQESVAVYRPMTVEAPGFEVEVRGSDVPEPVAEVAPGVADAGEVKNPGPDDAAAALAEAAAADLVIEGDGSGEALPPIAEPEPEPEPAHAVVHHADLGPDFVHIDSPECLCLKPASDDE